MINKAYTKQRDYISSDSSNLTFILPAPQILCAENGNSALKTEQEAHGPWYSAWEPTWPLTMINWQKFQKLYTFALSFYRHDRWGLIKLIFTPQAAVSEIQPDFQIRHIWEWNLAIGKNSRNAHTFSFYLVGEIELIFTLWAAVSKILADFQNCHTSIGMNYLAIGQFSSRSCTYSHSTPGCQNWTYFHSMGSSFQDMGRFSKLPYLGMKLGNLAIGQSLRSCTCSFFLT